VAGRLRWWDGRAWTDDVHDQAPAAAASLSSGSPLAASVLVVGPPRVATPGTRVFELADAAGQRLGRMVETSRGGNDSALGAALSRSRGWQHATTRELRGSSGYAELVLAWGPAAPGLIMVTLPDRREVGRLARGQEPVDGQVSWAVLGPDGRHLCDATRGGSTGVDCRRLSEVTPGGSGGWQVTLDVQAGPDPRHSLLIAAAAAADIL